MYETELGRSEILKRCDRNGDGRLTPDELPRARVFEKMDISKDGVVTPDEARTFYSQRRRAGDGKDD